MTLTAPALITERVILRPKYKTARTFELWFALNEDALITYFRALGPDDRGPEFLAFCSCQYDSWRLSR